jgi:hypothetical protein
MTLTKLTFVAALVALPLAACGQGRQTATTCTDNDFYSRAVDIAHVTYGIPKDGRYLALSAAHYDNGQAATVHVRFDGTTHDVDVRCVNGHAEVDTH